MPNILLEISGEITPERMKGWSQSKNNTQLCLWLVIEPRSMLGTAILHRNLECQVHESRQIGSGQTRDGKSECLLGASMGVPTHDKGHVERIWHAKANQNWRGPPGPAWASTPKPKYVCFTISRLSPTLLTLTGGYPRPPFSGKHQLMALINKSPGHERSISIQTPLLTF